MRPDEGGGSGHYTYPGDDPGSLAGLVSTLQTQTKAAESVSERLSGALPQLRSAWAQGNAGDTAYDHAGRVRTFLADLPPGLASAAAALDSYRADLTRARTTITDLNHAYAVLAPAERRVAAFGDWIETREEVAYDRAHSDYLAARSQVGYGSVADIDTAYRAVVGRVRGARDECAAVLAGLARAQALPGGRAGLSRLGGELPGMLTKEELLRRAGFSSMPTSAADVKRFWDSLSPSERQSLLAAEPKLWGNTNGVPVIDRDWANRTVLDSDLARYRQYFIDRGVTPPDSIDDFDNFTIEERRRLGLDNHGYYIDLDTAADELMEQYKDALKTKATLSMGHGTPPTFLMAYDATLYHGEGRAAIAFGNPDTATNIAVCVPGLESRVSKMDQIGGDAYALYRESLAADPTHQTAVIAWQGYDAPEFSNVMFQDHADAGARLLAADVAALGVTHGAGSPNVTVVAHSYGSTTAGLALQRYGLADSVNQVVLIGSPGVGGEAHSVTDLHLRDDQLYVGSASRDVVTTTYGQLGSDPSYDSFGGTRFKAENVNRDFGFPWQFDDHSRYYDDGTHSESLYAMADIVTGQGDQLDDHGMVAEGRRTDTITSYRGSYSIDVDPENSRTPTAGHQH